MTEQLGSAVGEILKSVGPIKVKLTPEELRVCQKASNGDVQAYNLFQAQRAASLILVVPRDKEGTLGDGAIGVCIDDVLSSDAALAARARAYFRLLEPGVWEYVYWQLKEPSAPQRDPWSIFRWIIESGLRRGINKLGGR